MSGKFEIGKWVLVVGDGDEVYSVVKIDDVNKRLVLSNGVWEPMDKCTIVPFDKVVRRVSYHYGGEE